MQPFWWSQSSITYQTVTATAGSRPHVFGYTDQALKAVKEDLVPGDLRDELLVQVAAVGAVDVPLPQTFFRPGAVPLLAIQLGPRRVNNAHRRQEPFGGEGSCLFLRDRHVLCPVHRRRRPERSYHWLLSNWRLQPPAGSTRTPRSEKNRSRNGPSTFTLRLPSRSSSRNSRLAGSMRSSQGSSTGSR